MAPRTRKTEVKAEPGLKPAGGDPTALASAGSGGKRNAQTAYRQRQKVSSAADHQSGLLRALSLLLQYRRVHGTMMLFFASMDGGLDLLLACRLCSAVAASRVPLGSCASRWSPRCHAPAALMLPHRRGSFDAEVAAV